MESHLFFFFSFFLRPHPWHMEIPRLGVKSEPQLPAYTTATSIWDLSCVCNLYHSSRQCWILNPLSKARDWTGILMYTSRVYYHWATLGTSILTFWSRESYLGLDFRLHRIFCVICIFLLLSLRLVWFFLMLSLAHAFLYYFIDN